MMIQEASEDFTEGGVMFSSFKTSYIEENTEVHSHIAGGASVTPRYPNN